MRTCPIALCMLFSELLVKDGLRALERYVLLLVSRYLPKWPSVDALCLANLQ